MATKTDRKYSDFEIYMACMRRCRREMIEKASNWLSKNAARYIYNNNLWMPSLIKDFKQAMEE